MTDVDARICKTQAHLYQYMADKRYDMEVFSDAFMKSDFCKMHFDAVYSPYQEEFPLALLELCAPELKEKMIQRNFKTEADRCYAGDIGYMYRKLYQETSVPSSKLAELIPYQELLKRFADDSDWFEEDHRGSIGIFEDIIREYKLPLKRYDSDFVYLTDEQMAEMKCKEELEQKADEEARGSVGSGQDEQMAEMKRREGGQR